MVSDEQEKEYWSIQRYILTRILEGNLSKCGFLSNNVARCNKLYGVLFLWSICYIFDETLLKFEDNDCAVWLHSEDDFILSIPTNTAREKEVTNPRYMKGREDVFGNATQRRILPPCAPPNLWSRGFMRFISEIYRGAYRDFLRYGR